MSLLEKVANNYWLLQVCRDRATWHGLKRARSLGVGLAGPHELRLRGLDRPLLYRPGSSDLLVAWELFRTGEYDVSRGFPFRSVVDCGANSGFFLGWFLRRTHGDFDRYVGVEADRDSFEALGRQAGALGVHHRCSLIHAAAWSHDEMVRFDDDGPSWGHSVSDTGRVEVRGLSIGSILDAAGMARCDLLKLDIEGGEKSVLESKGWAQRVDVTVAELHGGLDYEWFARTMRAQGHVPVPAGQLFRAHPGTIRRGSRFEFLATGSHLKQLG